MLNYLFNTVTPGQLSYPCAAPRRVLDSFTDAETAKNIENEIYISCIKFINSPKWSPVEYKDPEGGDLKLLSQEQEGSFHMVKASMSLKNVTPRHIVDTLHPDTQEKRQMISAALQKFSIVGRPAPNITVQHLEYYAPPPIAWRDFLFLASQRTLPDGSIVVCGCSIESKSIPADTTYTIVRGASMWCWYVMPVGDHCLVSYCNCFDPCGWAPRFLIEWLKTSVAKEIIAARHLVYGQKMDVKNATIEEIGMDMVEIEREIKERPKEEQIYN